MTAAKAQAQDAAAELRFEAFGGPRTMRSALPTVRLRAEGVLSFNEAAYAALGEPEALTLLYDRQARVIGVGAAAAGAAYAHPVHAQKGSSRLVYASAFLSAYRIPRDGLTTYENVQLENGLLLVELDTAKPRRRRLLSP